MQVKLTNSVAAKTVAVSARLFDSIESAVHQVLDKKPAGEKPADGKAAETPAQPADEKPSYAAAVAHAEPVEEEFVQAPDAGKK